MNRHSRISAMGREALSAVLLLSLALAPACSKKSGSSGDNAQLTFATPQEAGQALEAAARANDQQAIARILGPDAKSIVFSGDATEDKAALDSFVSKYAQMNRWTLMTDKSEVLNIGADNYPFPIPLAQNASSKWYFNTAAGQQEILARRIGRNELLAIDACSAMANAEEAYFLKPHDGNPARQYAAQIISTPGKQDGLYWDAAQGKPPSPLASLSDFAKDATSTAPGAPVLLDGYYFRVLNAQGDKADGGAKNYVANGKLTGGFAFIASPAKYGDSGLMTFILNREGVVYERDLGQNTAQAAAAITEYNPTEEWDPVE